ncbi:hypothetical protein [Streptomyces sp. NPDC047097]|uniref:hypothetical protein n=1 Tax=Streptomyces sp. NPDC047097 TaxID=3155260 RepID=UPI0033CEF873
MRDLRDLPAYVAEEEGVDRLSLLLRIQAAYDQAAPAPLADLAQRRPPQSAVDQYVRHVRRAIPEHADRIVEDPAFEALTAVLTEAEAAGNDPQYLLRQAADQRALDDTRSRARTLAWRVRRLSADPAPDVLATVAQARSTTRAAIAGQPLDTPPRRAAVDATARTPRPRGR